VHKELRLRATRRMILFEMRASFLDAMTPYADANGSYAAREVSYLNTSTLVS
jgi:hypothetical protein